MKFKVDENLPEEVCSLLREAGHDAMSVVEQQLAGTPDPRLHEVCIEEERIIVTLDVKFAREEDLQDIIAQNLTQAVQTSVDIGISSPRQRQKRRRPWPKCSTVFTRRESFNLVWQKG